jgi:hypothetical protein
LGRLSACCVSGSGARARRPARSFPSGPRSSAPRGVLPREGSGVLCQLPGGGVGGRAWSFCAAPLLSPAPAPRAPLPDPPPSPPSRRPHFGPPRVLWLGAAGPSLVALSPLRRSAGPRAPLAATSMRCSFIPGLRCASVPGSVRVSDPRLSTQRHLRTRTTPRTPATLRPPAPDTFRRPNPRTLAGPPLRSMLFPFRSRQKPLVRSWV